MAIRVYKPTSPARRFMSVLTFEEITKKKPEKSLTEIKKKHSGRNKQGKITVRHKGGGTRVYYRRIDFKRDKTDIPATVASIEYDPNRSAFIALLHYLDGEKRYILAPEGLKVGSKVISASSADIMPGNALPIENIPRRHPDPQCRDQGRPRRPNGPLRRDVRAVNGQGKRLCLVRLPSAELRKVPINAKATIGVVGNSDHENIRIGKAGPQAPHGHPPDGPRRRDEPGGPPARRRRGKSPVGMPAPGNPVGQGGAGPEDQKAQEVFQ